MPDDQDDTDAVPNPTLSMLVGDLRGRMRSHEQRMDRHETWVGDKFSSLETKIDTMVGKLDAIATTIAEQHGSRNAFKVFLQPVFALVVAGISGFVGICLHFYFRSLQ
jgi:hypothetical protein